MNAAEFFARARNGTLRKGDKVNVTYTTGGEVDSVHHEGEGEILVSLRKPDGGREIFNSWVMFPKGWKVEFSHHRGGTLAAMEEIDDATIDRLFPDDELVPPDKYEIVREVVRRLTEEGVL